MAYEFDGGGLEGQEQSLVYQSEFDALPPVVICGQDEVESSPQVVDTWRIAAPDDRTEEMTDESIMGEPSSGNTAAKTGIEPVKATETPDSPPASDKGGDTPIKPPGEGLLVPEEDPDDYDSAALEARFEPYKEQMRDIDARIAAGEDPSTIPGYLATGGVCYVFETSDGNILKLPRLAFDKEHEALQIPIDPNTTREEYIIPLARGVDIPGLEQLVGATEQEGGGVVVQRAPGVRCDQLSEADKREIPYEHCERLMQTCKDIIGRVQGDYDAVNIFYDPEHGFTLIDYSAAEKVENQIIDPALSAQAIGTTLALDTVEGLPTTFHDAYRAAFGEVAVPALDARLRTIERLRQGDSRETDLDLPAGLEHQLPAALTPSGLPGGDTQKFYVTGHPDLLVRMSETADPAQEYTFQELKDAKKACDGLFAFGVNVLPSAVVEGPSKPYMLTKRVEGVDLQTALANNPSPELLFDVDVTWKGLCDSLVNCKQGKIPFPYDVTTRQQFMYGTVEGDPRPKVWLVDLPRSQVNLGREDEFEVEVLEIANEVVGIEQQTGQRMSGARDALQRALTITKDSPLYGDGIINAVRHVLDSGEQIPMQDDSRLRRLRTH